MPPKTKFTKREITTAQQDVTVTATGLLIPSAVTQEQELQPQTPEAIVDWIIKKLQVVGTDLATCVQGKDVTVFLGNTRAGKSTVAKYLSGARLESVYWHSGKAVGHHVSEGGAVSVLESDKKDGWIYVQQITHEVKNFFSRATKNIPKGSKLIIIESDTKISEIGVGARSHTTTPKPSTAHADLENIKLNLLWDMPGFDDNRGVHQDLLNAFCIKELLTHSLSVKFVLVSDVNDLCQDNVNQFRDTLSKVSKMFSGIDIKHILGKIALIITKGEEDWVDTEVVKEYLTEKVLVTSISPDSQELVKHFVDNPHHIGFFHKPTTPRTIHCAPVESTAVAQVLNIDGHDTLVRAISSLNKVENIHLVDVRPPIDDASRTFLLEEYIRFREMRDFDALANAYDSMLVGEDKDFTFSGKHSKIEEWCTSRKKSVDPIRERVSDAKGEHNNLWQMVRCLSLGDGLLAKAKFVGFIDDQNLGTIKLSEIFKKQVLHSISVIEQKLKLFDARIHSQYIKIALNEKLQKEREVNDSLNAETNSLEEMKIHREEIEKAYKAAKTTTKQAEAKKKTAEEVFASVHERHTQQTKKCGELSQEVERAKAVVADATRNVKKAKEDLDKISPGQDAAIGGGVGVGTGAIVGGIIGAGIGGIVTFFSAGLAAPVIGPFAAWGAGIGGTLIGVGGAIVGYNNALKELSKAEQKLRSATDADKLAKKYLADIEEELKSTSNVLNTTKDELTKAQNEEKEMRDKLASLESAEESHANKEKGAERNWKEVAKKVADLNQQLLAVKDEISLLKVSESKCDTEIATLKRVLGLDCPQMAYLITQVKYDNPLLNHPDLMNHFLQLHGSKMLSDLIDLTSILDSNDMVEICENPYSIKSLELLMGISEHQDII